MKNVAVGSYEFGVKINDNWTSNGTAFTRANYSHAVTAAGSGNCTFVADIVGDYTFTWTYESNTLSILYPDMTTKEVKFFAPRTEENPWDHVYAFTWNGDVTYSAWPGVEITATKNSGWYSYDVPVGASVLFHDNNDMQTNDITNVQADVCYAPTAIDYDATPKKVSVAVDADCKVEYYIAGSKALIGGESDFGTFLPLDENNQIKFEDVAAGQYAFKLNINNWAWALGGNQHLSDEEGCGTIAKEVGTGDVGFAIDHTQDVTITYYPSTQKICLGAETTKSTASVTAEDMSVYVGKARSIQATKETDAEQIDYEILSGSEYINIADGKITGVAAGTATVRASVAETATYLGASDEFTVTVSALQTAKIRFFAPRTEDNPWAQVFAYAWIDDDPQSAAWPGDEITATKNSGWYEYDAPVGASVVFTDYNTAKGLMKTADIENVTEAKSFVPTSIYYPETPEEDKIVSLSEQNAVAYYISGSKALIGGESDFGINVALDENNQIVFHDVEPGTYAFKINNNTWAWSIGGIDHMKAGDCASIAQEVGVGDLGFKIDTKQDVTVTYYPETQEICLGAVTVKETGTVEGADMNIKSGESKKISYTTNNTEDPNVTYMVVSGSEYIGLFKGVITGIKPGEATIRVSLTETANYTAASDEFTVTISNAVAPAKAISPVGGKFIINAKGDTAVFSRGNLKYNVATSEWYCADNQYDFVGEGGNLHFGDANYTGEFDLFGWSCTASNYGLMQSNHDEVYTGEFVDWGGLFAGGEQEWATPTGSELYYIINHHQWTIMALDPTPDDADNEDEIYGLAIFPLGWVQPAGFDDLTYSYSNWWDEETIAKNTFALSKWSDLEAAGAVFLPHAGARAGHWGNTWNGKEESTAKNPNPNGGNSYCWVDNIGWYGYYWSSTTDPRSEHPYDAQYLITPGWSEGPTEADEDDLYIQPQVWSREKRRGNSVRLINRIPRQYTVTYDANGAEGEAPVDNDTYLEGAQVTIKGAGTLEIEGYDFAGWQLGENVYQENDHMNAPAQDMTFVAQWTLMPSVTLRDGLSDGKWGTYCPPRKVLNAEGATFYQISYLEEQAGMPYNMIFDQIEGTTLTAGKPYFFIANASEIRGIQVGDALTAADPAGVNGFYGYIGDASMELTVHHADYEATEDNTFIIYNNSVFRINQGGTMLRSERCYINISPSEPDRTPVSPAPTRRRVTMNVTGTSATTGMENVQTSEGNIQKVMIDGQLFILRGEKMYDATGRMVK